MKKKIYKISKIAKASGSFLLWQYDKIDVKLGFYKVVWIRPSRPSRFCFFQTTRTTKWKRFSYDSKRLRRDWKWKKYLHTLPTSYEFTSHDLQQFKCFKLYTSAYGKPIFATCRITRLKLLLEGTSIYIYVTCMSVYYCLMYMLQEKIMLQKNWSFYNTLYYINFL